MYHVSHVVNGRHFDREYILNSAQRGKGDRGGAKAAVAAAAVVAPTFRLFRQ